MWSIFIHKMAHSLRKRHQNRICKNFLHISQIFSSEDEKGKLLSEKFTQTGIWQYENKAIAAFSFHHNGLIDQKLVKTQLQQAREVFQKELLALKTDKIYISLTENDVFCWVEVDFQALCQHLHQLWQQGDDFFVLIEDAFALAIHRGEYEWEVLCKKSF